LAPVGRDGNKAFDVTWQRLGSRHENPRDRPTSRRRRRFPREPAQDAGQHCRNERCDCGQTHQTLRRRSSVDADLGFIDPCTATDWTLARFREPVRLEYEFAGTAFCGNYRHKIAGRLCGSDRMPQILFGIRTLQTEVARDCRYRPRLCGQQLDQILSDRHVAHFRWLTDPRR
jgi:hypothetical protein